MQQLPKEFIGRMVRTILFIGLVAACCAGVATFGMLVASKFNLTTSRNQVPLTSVKIEGEKVLDVYKRQRYRCAECVNSPSVCYRRHAL